MSEAIEGYVDQIEAHTRALAEKDGELVRLRTQAEGMDDKFKSLAQDVLKQANDQFLQLATQKLEGEQKDAAAQLEQRKAAIEQLLKPVRESLDKHASAVSEIEKDRKGAYGELRQQLTTMLVDQKALRGETASLVNTLKNNAGARGRWGEMQLKRVAELAGMIEHCDFTEQVTVSDGNRPDMVVKLPAGREVVVDSKTPLDAYISAVQATEDHERDTKLGQHAQHVRDRVKELSSKSYQGELSRSVDFVVMFIPGEAFLQAALQRDPELLEWSFNRNVVISTPSTLIALLKAVEIGWREERVAENARHIADLGQELHKRVATAIGHVGSLGKSIESAVAHYNKLVGSMETSVLPQTRRFEELGAKSQKELPAEIKVVETQPRALKSES